MKRLAAMLAVVLACVTLTPWIDDRLAWGLLQIAMYLLAAWRLIVGDRLRHSAALWPLAAAVAWPFLQLALHTSQSPSVTLIAALDWSTFFVIFAIASDVLSDRDARLWFLRALSVIGLSVATLSVLQFYSSAGRIFWLFPSGYTDGVLGPFVNHGQYSAWIELILPVAFYLSLTDRRVRLLHGLSLAVMVASVVAGASRAGVVLAGAELITVAAIAFRRRLAPRATLFRALVQVAVLAAVSVAVAGWSELQNRVVSGTHEALRADAIRASLQMVRDHPITGLGLGVWPILYPKYAGFDSGLYMNQAHNDWAQWGAEGGWPFVFFLILFAALLCKPAIRSIYGLGIVAFLLHALVDFPMQQRPGLAAWFFALAGAAAAWEAHQSYDGLLRRTGNRAIRLDRRDPARLQAAGAVAAPRP